MLRKSEIKQYLTEEFASALDAWNKTTLYGLANGNIGWANEPSNYIDAIFALESEKNRMDAEEAEERQKKMGKSTPTATPSTASSPKKPRRRR